LSLPGNFHFSRFTNTLARAARGDYLLLLNNDTEVLQDDWLEHLLYCAEQPDVGAVGPLLRYPNGAVQHAGVILGPRGTADHVLRGSSAETDGYAGSLRCTREVSALTGACLMVSKQKYWDCGGLNEHFRRHYEDVDFCLRLQSRGWRNLYVASVALIHHESMTRGSIYDFTDRFLLLDYWEPQILRGDPYYNPNFDPSRVDYALREGAEPE
jgi:GT2 family glycosyltransferase